MIVDSSALVAILRGEPEAAAISDAIARHHCSVSAPTVLETSIVVKPVRHPHLDQLLTEASIEVVAFDHRQAVVAREAYARHGKGSGSPAQLNFGDCMAYALAVTTGEPLLFTGGDFAHTDVVPALPSV